MDTSPIVFLLNMAAAAALLIWAVRLARTGFERAFGSRLRLWLRRSTANRWAAAASGASAAVLMQSSTAVAVLMAGFVSTGAIGGAAALTILLGADLGSAIVAQILNSRLDMLMPLLLLAGVLIFLRSARREFRQIGRILIGLALVFLSLDLIRAASLPLAESTSARAVMVYLADDLLTAFIIAAAFAWLVHSSVAAILLYATLAAEGLLPASAANAMVLGANLGGAIIAIALTMRADIIVRRVVWINLVLRGGGAALVLLILDQTGFNPNLIAADAGQAALNLHLMFNLLLLAICLPLIRPSLRLAESVLPNPQNAHLPGPTLSNLDLALFDQPSRAVASAVRGLVQMADRIEIALRRVMILFQTYDEPTARAIRSDLVTVSQMSLDLRIYLSQIKDHDDTVGTRPFDLAGIAVNLEAGAELISQKMIELAQRKNLEELRFSDAGWQELSDFHDTVLRNVQHGISVLMTEDVGLARELMEQKESVREVAQRLEHAHLGRLRQGLSESIETSSIHLDLLRSLKALNTAFAMIAYPLLQGHGELLDSRLANQSERPRVAETSVGVE